MFKNKRIQLLEKLLEQERERNRELLNRLLAQNNVQPIVDKHDIENEIDKLKVSLFAEVDEKGNEIKVNDDGSIR